jgi:AAA domain
MKKKKKIQEDRAQYAKMTKEERLQAFKRTIAHPHLQAADKALREAVQETGGASLVNVYGPARVGKSTMKNHVIRTIILEMLPLLEQDRERVPLLSMMPRPPLSGSFSWRDFFQNGLVAFDEPLIDHKIALDTGEDEEQTNLTRRDESRIKRKLPEGTKDALRVSFETAIKQRRPVAIIIDEAQHLGKVSSAQQLQNQLDCIKSLADVTGTVFVLIGTYELLPLRNLSAQLIGRSLDIHFPRYRSTEQELAQFENVLRTFQDGLPFVEETDILLEHWEFCYERSIGCVGNLRLMLVRAVRAALLEDAKTLRWNDLKTHAFSEAESYEMMLEAYEGEKELASKPKQRADLLKMLGLSPQNTSRSKSQPDVPSTGETSAGLEATQGDLRDETTNGAKQPLPTEDTPSETPSELRSVHGSQLGETMDEARQGLPTEKTRSEGAPSKPLKKPNTAASQPFRRKAKRDKTGGPPQENEERAE